AASLIKTTNVFRGTEHLLRGLDRALTQPESNESEQRKVREARFITEQLLKMLMPLDRRRTWHEQTTELRRIAWEMGIDSREPSTLDSLWDALDDQTEILERLKQADEVWSWARFVGEVEDILEEMEVVPSAPPGSIRLATVDQIEGARAEHVIL